MKLEGIQVIRNFMAYERLEPLEIVGDCLQACNDWIHENGYLTYHDIASSGFFMEGISVALVSLGLAVKLDRVLVPTAKGEALGINMVLKSYTFNEDTLKTNAQLVFEADKLEALKTVIEVFRDSYLCCTK